MLKFYFFFNFSLMLSFAIWFISIHEFEFIYINYVK